MALDKSSANTEILEYALKHMVSQRDAIQARLDEVRRRLGQRPSEVKTQTPISGPLKRNLTPDARKRIAEAQNRRWEKVRMAKTASA